VSSRPPHSAAGRRAPLQGHAPADHTAEGWTPIEYNSAHRRGSAGGRSGSLQRRRAAAVRARRRRLLAIDLALGLALALLAIALAPGLALVALLALLGLLACAVSLAYGRRPATRRLHDAGPPSGRAVSRAQPGAGGRRRLM
jgi:Flp pilus assembly protein TadB